MEFSRPEHWSAQPFASPGDLPNPGIEPRSPALQAGSLPTELSGKSKEVLSIDKNSRGFPGGSVVKNLPASAGDLGLIPDPGRSHIPRSN